MTEIVVLFEDEPRAVSSQEEVARLRWQTYRGTALKEFESPIIDVFMCHDGRLYLGGVDRIPPRPEFLEFRIDRRVGVIRCGDVTVEWIAKEVS